MLLGGVLGKAWMELWPGSPLGSYAIIGGAAVLGAAMQGPLAAVVLLLELTHQADSLMVPILIAVVEATVLARLLRAPSIYSARLSALARGRARVRAQRPAARAVALAVSARQALCRGGWTGAQVVLLTSMPRAIWTGAICFGLVTVPVKLYSALDRKTVRFHQLSEQERRAGRAEARRSAERRGGPLRGHRQGL